MTVHFVYALLCLVADSGDFVALLVCFNNFGRDFSATDLWSTNGGFLTIYDKKGYKSCSFAFRLQKLYFKGFPFGYEVLLTTCSDDCFFYAYPLPLFIVTDRAYQMSPLLSKGLSGFFKTNSKFRAFNFGSLLV